MVEQNKELVRRYYEQVINGRDLDAAGDYFADERMVEGVRRGCFAYYGSFPDLHASIEELIAEGDTVFCRGTMTGSHDGEYEGIAPTGRNVAIETAEVFRIAGGRFVGYWCLADVAGATRRLTDARAAAAG
jgi:predicted ester cyclase